MRSLLLLAMLCCCTRDASPTAHAHAHGEVHFATSCDPRVRGRFDEAVALLHHMTYRQARDAFRDVAARDPRCAMAHWGIAMTLFTPLWPTRPSKQDLEQGWSEARAARDLAPPTARERALVAAVVAFFEHPEETSYWARIARWAAAMAAAYEANRTDVEVAAFYALALLATARPGPTTRDHSERAVAILRPIARAHPDHPGAMHYIIHADDIPGREDADLDVVRRYEARAHDNPHALHMPTHIYTRLGDWEGVIRGNLRAAAAALRYPTGEHGELVWDEFPHAIEYLVYAYLQQGADARARAQIERLLATAHLEPSAKTAFHLASTRARYTLERHAWEEAAALVPGEPASVDWKKFPWPDAVVWFAHGFGALRTGDHAEAERARARLAELEQRAATGEEETFARQIQMLRLVLEGWSAHVAGDDATAVARLRQAVEVEYATPKPPVTPAPTLPAEDVIGDLMLELGRPDEALAAYRGALAHYPRRFDSLLGVARALAAKRDAAAAARAYCELREVAPAGERAGAEIRGGCEGAVHAVPAARR